ncbi:class I adenylate-forming enzyme family protein [Streptomyces sp. NPDC058001]|uniref:class I adenylate-forming enzyme family protein n=1 Tax=Streptomyces sp. NPDC058001 TaxID=3346300 RepID=UPI0036ED11D0
MSRPDGPTAGGSTDAGSTAVGSSVATTVGYVARRHPDRIAVVDADGRRTAYRDLVTHASRAAHALTALGVRRGDRVAAWMADGSAYVELYLACATAGFVVVPLNTRCTVHEVRALIADAEPRALVWSADKDGAVEALRDEGVLTGMASVRQTRQTRRPGDGTKALDAHDWSALVASGSSVHHPVTTPDDLLVIGYTSGTTGRPKGALLTHRSVSAVVRQHAAAYRLPPHSTIVMTGSMSFVSVVPAHVLTHLALAGTIVFPGHWDVSVLLDQVERHRADFTYLPSPVLTEFARVAARHPTRWRSLAAVLHSASKVPAAALAELADVVGSRLVEGWGMTENSGGLMTATSAADIEGRRAHPAVLETVGRPLPGYEVRVADGELLLRGPAVVTGYWRRPEATRAAFEGGWFATGDLGTVDERGYVTVLERRTDLILSGGMNVYPAEVEAVIATVPGVAACAVVGVPHPRWGQTVVAMVVPRDGTALDPADISARCRERLAGYKKPTEILLAAHLPTTVAQKVSRAAVREVARERLRARAHDT